MLPGVCLLLFTALELNPSDISTFKNHPPCMKLWKEVFSIAQHMALKMFKELLLEIKEIREVLHKQTGVLRPIDTLR